MPTDDAKARSSRNAVRGAQEARLAVGVAAQDALAALFDDILDDVPEAIVEEIAVAPYRAKPARSRHAPTHRV